MLMIWVLYCLLSRAAAFSATDPRTFPFVRLGRVQIFRRRLGSSCVDSLHLGIVIPHAAWCALVFAVADNYFTRALPIRLQWPLQLRTRV